MKQCRVEQDRDEWASSKNYTAVTTLRLMDRQVDRQFGTNQEAVAYRRGVEDGQVSALRLIERVIDGAGSVGDVVQGQRTGSDLAKAISVAMRIRDRQAAKTVSDLERSRRDRRERERAERDQWDIDQLAERAVAERRQQWISSQLADTDLALVVSDATRLLGSTPNLRRRSALVNAAVVRLCATAVEAHGAADLSASLEQVRVRADGSDSIEIDLSVLPEEGDTPGAESALATRVRGEIDAMFADSV